MGNPFLFPVPTDIDYLGLGPILLVVFTGIAALVVEMLRPKRNNNTIVWVCLVGLAAAGLVTGAQFAALDNDTLGDMFMRDRFGSVMELLLILACILTVMFSEGYLREKRVSFGEFYPLVLWSTAGAMLMVTSKNLLVIFLGLELLSIALYVMAGLSRKEQKSEESAMKYFLLGAFASGFFLYGIAFFYGATGSLNLDALRQAWMFDDQSRSLLLIGLGFALIGLCFKSAFVPFHQWTPDVYQGAPTNVTAFMAAASKIAAIAVLFRLLDAVKVFSDLWMPVLFWVAILTMTVGNLIALAQRDVKRILAYSSIAHAGYLLVAVLAHVKSKAPIGFGTVAYYLLSYCVMTVGAFAVVSLAAKDGKEGTRLEDLNGLWRRSPLAAGLLVLFLASLIGIPPTAGFFGKFYIFKDALSAGLAPLAIVLAVNSVVSIAYYLSIARAAFVADEDSERGSARMNLGVAATCVACAAGVVLAGIFGAPLLHWLVD